MAVNPKMFCHRHFVIVCHRCHQRRLSVHNLVENYEEKFVIVICHRHLQPHTHLLKTCS